MGQGQSGPQAISDRIKVFPEFKEPAPIDINTLEPKTLWCAICELSTGKSAKINGNIVFGK